ncbi:MAG: hypothetical protein ABIO79_09795 [Ferruginibacter sp.]
MIKFKPAHVNNNTGTIDSMMENFHAIAENKVANQLNEKDIKFSCILHPVTESIVLVDMKEDKMKFEIQTCCCDEFKRKLEQFLARQ